MANLDDFEENLTEHLLRSQTCVSCKQAFSDENVFTVMGWREVQISQMCEKCFDDCTLRSEEE